MNKEFHNPQIQRRIDEVFDFESHPGIAVVRPEVAKQISEGLKNQRAQQIADMATPPESRWAAEDIENQRRTAAEVERQIERMHIKMVMAVGAVGILLAVAIHFLSTP